MSKNENGFSLIELITVIVILGILTGFLAINFTSTKENVNLESARKKLVADLIYAQDLAMSFGSSVQVVFDIGENQYFLKWIDGSYVTNIMGGGNFIVDFDHQNFAGISIDGSDLVNGTLIFNSIGVPMTGDVEIQNTTLVANINNQSYIKVTPYTGRIIVENVIQ